MPNKQPTANSQLPDRLYGEHYPDSFLDVSRPVRESSVATLGDYIRHLQEVDKQSDKPCVACEPVESKFDHICPNNPILTCNCVDPKYCAEQPNDNGWLKCPDSGKLCSTIDCPDGCKGDKPINEDRCPNHDGFSDNLDYTGIPVPNTKGKAAVSGWPCVVVGAICETWTSAAKHVLRTTASEWNTKCNTDARLNNDGLASTTGV